MSFDDEYPVILGYGSVHTLTDGPEPRKAKKTKKRKAHPLGFQVPKASRSISARGSA